MAKSDTQQKSKIINRGSHSTYILVLVARSCHVHLFVTPWTVACQDPLSMEFLGQEYWSGLLFPSPGDLPDPGNNPVSPAWQEDLPVSYLGSPIDNFTFYI